MSFMKLSVSTAAIIAASTFAASARDQIQIAGSSTVLPYATIVAEAFGENFDFPTPVVEGGGSGAGRKKMCEGVGENTIDIANSSSRIKQSDIDLCATNGVNEIMEVRIGYDGIVFASDINGPDFAFTPADLYGALAANVAKDGALELVKAQVGGDKKAAVKECLNLRTDGKSVDIDGDYTETLARIDANKTAVGVFGLSFYENNMDKLKVATVNGVSPSVETISAGEYPVSRPLYFYVKKAHLGVIPGLKEYIEFFLSDDMAGPGGVLAGYGLVPDPELAATQAAVAAETPMGPLN